MANSTICVSRSKVYAYLLGFFFCLVFAKNSIAQPNLSLTAVISTGLSSPIQLVNAGDGSKRIFIVQQGATIRAYDAAFNFISVFLTVSGVNTGGERGLLSMAFHPDYSNNGLFYVYYTNTAGNLELARYQVSAADSNIADPASKVILITIPHPTNSNHNGGELHFGNDGYLYLSTGDGGGGGDVPNNAQNTSVLLGKILRFNVNTSATAPYYTIPAGNPYGNEIFDLGLRNPFRWSFDRLTHDIWIGDVGQDSYEEINYRPAASTAGVNYGWHCYEGNNTYNTTGCGPIGNYVFPVYTYPTQNPSAAITGGVVYRGMLYPAMQGYNISADFFSGTFYKTVSNGLGGWTTTTQILAPTGIADFGETEDGETYAVCLTGNSIYRVSADAIIPLTLVDFGGQVNDQGVLLNWQTASEQDLQKFDIEYSTDGASFTHFAMLPAQHTTAGYRYNVQHDVNYNGVLFYRLKMINIDGSYTYSNTIRILLNNRLKNIVAPSVISDGVIRLSLASPCNYVELVGMDGNVFIKENLEGRTGEINIPVNRLASGAYIVRLSGNAVNTVQKIFIMRN